MTFDEASPQHVTDVFPNHHFRRAKVAGLSRAWSNSRRVESVYRPLLETIVIHRASSSLTACWTSAVLVLLATPGATDAQRFAGSFETAPVHAAVISDDGQRLYAVHPTGASLVVYSLQTPRNPVRLHRIAVGLEPTSVRLRSPREAWVVNRLSDSISVVSLDRNTTIATIPTADEPADLVFAGSPPRAFVSAAGADVVQVFDPVTRRELTRIPVFGEEPTALAVDAGGERVFVVVHRSGNGTTIVRARDAPPQSKPTKPQLPDGPSVPRIVSAEDPRWKAKHEITLPDIDLVEIDAQSCRVKRSISGIGTMNFGLAVHPTRDELWITNTEAHNLIHFEPALRGRFVTNRITRVDLGHVPRVVPIDLNKGVDYDVLPNDAAKALALAQATDVVYSPDGRELWIAAFGTDRVARLDREGKVVARVEVGDSPGTKASPRTKRGPRSLALHPTQSLLYVVCQIQPVLVVVDTHRERVLRELKLGPDPMPRDVREGRGFLYDAKLSGNGLVSCASCHVDARRDGLAWDLGDPGGELRILERRREPFVTFELHPMKGPLLTQTLLGLAGQEPYHWRGDRDGLHAFNETFRTLLGGKELAAEDLARLTRFLQRLRFPPNPNQGADRSYSTTPVGESARDGFEFFKNANFSGASPPVTCVSCHTRPSGSSDEVVIGRESAQYMTTPHLRNVYKRTGRRPVGGRSKSGFGLLHAGHEDGVFEFLSSDLMFLGKLAREASNKRMLERFLLEFDTGTAPTVGRSLTLTRENRHSRRVTAEVALLWGQAKVGNCDLVAHVSDEHENRSWAWDRTRERFLPDRSSEKSRRRDEILDHARRGATVSITAVPVHAAATYSIDRDANLVLDGDERPVLYGASSPACAKRLHLESNGVARLGSSDFAIVARGAPRNSTGLFVVSSAPASIRMHGLTLLVEPRASISISVPSDRRGVASTAFAIPSDPGLAGRAFFVQALFSSTCSSSGISASNGLHGTLRP